MKSDLKRPVLFSIATTLAVLASSCNATRFSEEEQRILISVKEHLSAMGTAMPDRVELGFPPDETVLPPVEHDLCFRGEKPSKELITAFSVANERAHYRRSGPSPSRWMDEFAAWFVGTQPDTPRRLIMSRAGFSNDRTRSLVYVELHAPLAGLSSFFLLSRRNDREWRIEDDCVLEIS